MDEVKIGRRIREERLRLGLTQESLAEDVDLTTAYIGQVERGERNLKIESLVKVANRLGVTVDYLLMDSLTAETDPTMRKLAQLINGRPQNEKEMVVDIVAAVLTNLDRANA